MQGVKAMKIRHESMASKKEVKDISQAIPYNYRNCYHPTREPQPYGEQDLIGLFSVRLMLKIVQDLNLLNHHNFQGRYGHAAGSMSGVS